MGRDTGDLLQGTLGLLILKALAGEERHGYGIARWIEDATGAVVQIEEGSLYPALRRLEDRGFAESRWGLSENNRRARYYAITAAGRRHLRADASTWLHFARAVMRALEAEPSVVV
jgi:transcriptional regulator